MSESNSTHKICLKCGAALTSLSVHNCGQCGANQIELAKERMAAQQLTETLKMKIAQDQGQKATPSQPFSTSSQHNAQHQNPSDKQGQTALLLCVTLGMVGAHRFYVGKVGSALLLALAPVPTFIAVIAILVRFGQEQIVSGIAFSLALVLTVYAAVGIVVIRDLIHISSARFKDKQGNRIIF